MKSSTTRCLIACTAGLAVFAFGRMRGSLGFYRDFHGWMHRSGVPGEIRNLDYWLLLTVVAFAGAAFVARSNPLRALGLLGSRSLGTSASLRQALKFGLIASSPMFAQAALFHHDPQFSWKVFQGSAIAPFVEEVFFRGLLVAIPVSCCRVPFWFAAIPAGAVFAAAHVSWNDALTASDGLTLLVTFAAGVWYAWLVRIYAWNLWTTIVLHAGMNASWLIFNVGGGAVGSGLWPNLGRAATITVGTMLALRYRRQSATN